MDDSATHPAGLPLDRVREAGMTPVLLVRHARTSYNARRMLVGRLDVPLDQEGRRQAKLLATRLVSLRGCAVYCSPLQRAVQTASALGDPKLVPDLVEVDHGQLEGLAEAELESRHAAFLARWAVDPEHTRIPGGESLGQALDRALPALTDIVAQQSSAAPVVVCSHQLVIATLLCAVQGLSLARYKDLTSRTTGISLLGWCPAAWRVFCVDDLAHLEAGQSRAGASASSRRRQPASNS